MKLGIEIQTITKASRSGRVEVLKSCRLLEEGQWENFFDGRETGEIPDIHIWYRDGRWALTGIELTLRLSWQWNYLHDFLERLCSGDTAERCGSNRRDTFGKCICGVG